MMNKILYIGILAMLFLGVVIVQAMNPDALNANPGSLLTEPIFNSIIANFAYNLDSVLSEEAGKTPQALDFSDFTPQKYEIGERGCIITTLGIATIIVGILFIVAIIAGVIIMTITVWIVEGLLDYIEHVTTTIIVGIATIIAGICCGIPATICDTGAAICEHTTTSPEE